MRINLFAGGKRSAVEPAEAASINERFQRESEDNTVYKIDLSCRQWKRESIDIVVAHLKEVSRSVRFVNLADVIAGLMTDEGLGVTELLAETFKIANLLEIDLSDNAMGVYLYLYVSHKAPKSIYFLIYFLI
jgi:Ran GTPase-activating protein (RanGAP) involved in mRNA processing and transport